MDSSLKIFKYFSQCNKYINTNMIKVLKENENIFNKKLNGHYKSINDILFHIYDVDLSWLNDLKSEIKSEIFEENVFKNFNENIEPINPYKILSDYEKDRLILDILIIDFINKLDEKDLIKFISYKNKEDKMVWEILIHTFNHQTHHRGQISEILDENGIKNDFSNMIRYDINTM